ncbi:MAG: N-acetyltransferase family protein [Treponema sp.]
MTIRYAEEKDLIPIRNIAHNGIEGQITMSSNRIIHVEDYSANDEFVREALANNDCLVLVAEEDSTIIGWLLAYLQPHHENAPFYKKRKVLYLDTVDVLSTVRRKGIAKKLITAAEQWAKEQHFEEIKLDVFFENYAAKSLYDSLGYTIITETRGKLL